MKVRVRLMDQGSGRSVALNGEMSSQDMDFLNELGERIAQGTEWEIVVVATENGV